MIGIVLPSQGPPAIFCIAHTFVVGKVIINAWIIMTKIRNDRVINYTCLDVRFATRYGDIVWF